LRDVQAAIAGMPAADLAAKAQAGGPLQLPVGGVTGSLDPGDAVVHQRGPAGRAGGSGPAPQGAIGGRITQQPARGGMGRDVVRQVQELRKQSNLEMEDRIELYLGTPSERLREAIETHREYIAGETLTQRWSSTPLDGQAHQAKVKVESQE